jgi:hypothetical protein
MKVWLAEQSCTKLKRALFIGFALVAILGTVASSSWASTSYVDGISDQSIPNWDSGFSGSYFAGFFGSTWVSAGHVRDARYVLQWNVMSESGEPYTHYRQQFTKWVEDAGAMGLTLDVALTRYVGVYPSTSAEYKERLKEILNQAKALGHAVRYVEAWNEPNNQGGYKKASEAVTPAHFANSAYAACEEGYGCAVIAGNVEDNSGAKAYEEEYRKGLSPVPAVWGVHPYYSVEERNESYYTKAVEGMPNGGAGDQVWITEVAVRMCTPSKNNAEAGQAERARWLVDTLIHNKKPEHVFYYEFMLGERRVPTCSEFDDALYVPSSDPNASDAPRAAADLIFGGKGVPAAYTGAATISSTEASATVSSSIYPGGILTAKYHIEYGTSGSYGLYSAEKEAGSSSSRVEGSSVLAGLAPSTTYHYRIAAWNSEGAEAPSYGSDHTFTTPGPPAVELSGASAFQETRVTLNGSVNPSGADTRYYFQYGATTQYGSYLPVPPPGSDMGAGTSAVPVNAALTGLQPGITYHYRLVAKSWAGETVGADSTVTTLYEEASARWAVRDGATNDQFVFYRSGVNAELWETFEPGTGWGAYERGLTLAPGTTPAVVRDPSTGHTYVFYQGNNGALWESYEPGTGWASHELGLQMSPGTSPSAVRDPNTGHLYVFYRGSNGALWETLEPGTGWGATELGLQMAANTSPAAIRDPLTNHILVFYEGSNNALWETLEPGTGWGAQQLAAQMAPGASPSAVRDPTTGRPFVFYQGSNGALWETYEPGAGWATQELGLKMAPDTSPSAAGEPTTGELSVFYQGSNHELWQTIEPGTGWGAYELGREMAPGTSPAALRDPVTGHQWVYYEGANAQLWESLEPGTGWGAYELGREMSLSPPSANTAAASAIQETQAGLNGTIDAQGAETKYHFEYGPTSAYGSRTSEVAADSGTTNQEVSQPVTSLTFEGTYHYRLVATNSRGTTYGEDHSFKTQSGATAETSPAATVNATTSEEFVFFEGHANQLYEWASLGAMWTQSRLGGAMAPGTSPSAVMSSSGHPYVFYEGSNGALWETYEPGTGWGAQELGAKVASGTSPGALLLGSHLYVFYQGSNQQLWETYEPGTGWGSKELGTKMVSSTSPSAVGSGSTISAFYQATEGQIWRTFEPGSGWGAASL